MQVSVNFETRLRERREALARVHLSLIHAEYDHIALQLRERAAYLMRAGKVSEAYRLRAVIRVLRNIQTARGVGTKPALTSTLRIKK